MVRHRSAADAIAAIQSGHRVFVHGGVATPLALVNALVDQASRLRDVELVHLHTSGAAPYADPRYAGSFRVVNLFVGANMRGRLDAERVDYLPVFLSEIPALFRSRRRLDVALVQVSPPDRHGFVSLGTSVDIARAAVDTAAIVIAQVNPRMSRVHGDGILHIDRLHHWYEEAHDIPETPPEPLGPIEQAIGRHVAGLIDDAATLQLGIGAIPNAVLAELGNHRGKPIIALPSRTSRGQARIVSQLRPGAGVVTTRAHVHYVVTEYGVADLYGKTLAERARALIAIAHPGDRDQLQRDLAR